MKLSIFTTATDPYQRLDPYHEAMASYQDIADEIVEVGKDWPKEFKWDYIGQQFQNAYEMCTGDWVIHADLDYIFHENDIDRIRKTLELNSQQPAMSFFKYQFVLIDRYTLKSHVVIAVNRGRFKHRIRFNSGGDLCQPSLDGLELEPADVPSARIPFYNYDFSFKTESVIRNDFGRFARAWGRQFGDYKIGGPDDESAFRYFLDMQLGRFHGRDHRQIALADHPKYITNRIGTMKPDQFGYSLFGHTQPASYFK